MDIKIGTSSIWLEDPHKTREGIEDAIRRDKSTTTTTLGLRFCGLRVHLHNGEVRSYGKPWGKKVTDSTFLSSLKEYFHNGSTVLEFYPILIILKF
jgi:hypothetical protein